MTREEAIKSLAECLTDEELETAYSLCSSDVMDYCIKKMTAIQRDACVECLSLFNLDTEGMCPCQEGIFKETILFTIREIINLKKEMKNEKNIQD